MELWVGTDPPQLTPTQDTFWGVGVLVLKWDFVLDDFVYRAAIAGELLHDANMHPCRPDFYLPSGCIFQREKRYGVEIRPLLVATIQRLPQSTIESTFPRPGTVSPLATLNIPLGPSKTAVSPRTSRTFQPSMVVGLVSGTGVSLGKLSVGRTVATRGAGNELFRFMARVTASISMRAKAR